MLRGTACLHVDLDLVYFRSAALNTHVCLLQNASEAPKSQHCRVWATAGAGRSGASLTVLLVAAGS